MEIRMKKIGAMLLGVTMIAVLGGCAAKEPARDQAQETKNSKAVDLSEADSGTADSSKADSDAADRKTAVLRWHSANGEDNPRTQVGYFMQERIQELTGDLVIEVYANSQLGSSDDVHSMIAMGENIASATDSAWFSSMQPGFDIINGPFFTDTEEELYKVAETPWFKQQVEELEGKGVKILATNWMDGSRFLMTTKPIYAPSDLAGLKIRIPNNTCAIEIMQAMGATATPMSLSEVYTAIQQKIIDGMENPLSTLYARSTHEVCKYVTMTGHQKMLSLFFVSTDWFNTLSPEAQDALIQVAEEAGEYFSNELMPADNEKALEVFKEAGVDIIYDFDLEAFKKATLPVYEKLWNMDTYRLIKEQMEQAA